VLEKQSYRVSGLGRVVGRAVEMIMGGRQSRSPSARTDPPEQVALYSRSPDSSHLTCREYGPPKRVADTVPHSWFTLYVQLVSLPNKDLYQPTAHG
jgi:hypothetical protein